VAMVVGFETKTELVGVMNGFIFLIKLCNGGGHFFWK